MENRYKISYDIKRYTITNIKFKQGDVDSSVLEISLFDDGVPVDISGENIEFRFLKPDKTIVYQDFSNGVTILDATKGRVSCVLKSNTLAVPGIVKCEIHRGKDNKQLTTPTFNFLVESSIGEDGIKSTNYIKLIDSKLIDWQSQIDSIQSDYNDLKRIIIDENQAANLQNQINSANVQITKNSQQISDMQAYVGYTDNDIVGVEVDFKNKVFTRLAGAVGKILVPTLIQSKLLVEEKDVLLQMMERFLLIMVKQLTQKQVLYYKKLQKWKNLCNR